MLFDSPIFFVFLILLWSPIGALVFAPKTCSAGCELFFLWLVGLALPFIDDGSTIVDYFIAHAIARASSDARRKQLLLVL